MAYYLPKRLSFCDCGGQIVFLDIARDRYFQLSPSLGTALRALMDGRPAPADAVAGLLRRSLIVKDCSAGRPLAPIAATLPAQSAIEANPDAPKTDWRTAPEVARRLVQARIDLRTKTLCAIVDRVETAKKHIPRMRRSLDIRAIERLALRFHRAHRLVPIKPVCLPDSLALLAFLFSRGAAADLVIAVSGPPFQAHCWVQAQDTLLNGPLDHALSFTPIRII